MKKDQREATKHQIVKAALIAIAEKGYDSVSTRYIASVAGVSQGLLTYHFKSKESLWCAAADHLFDMLNTAVDMSLLEVETESPLAAQRELLRRFVYFNAEHPELHRFMIQQGKDDGTRTEWLVDTHIVPMFKTFSAAMTHIPEKDIPHMFYAIAGACGTIFSVPYECDRTTGIKPTSPATIEAHADYIINVFLPLH